MKRVRKSARLHFRKRLQIELLEARTLLASDLTNPILIEGREAVRNELLVQYSPLTLAAQRNSAAIAASVTVAETIHTPTMRASGSGVLERVLLNPGVDMQTAMQALKKNPNVLYVEPNYIYRPSVISNDTRYTNGSLWGMYSNDTPTAIGPAGTTNQFGSQAEKAWNDNIIGNSSVIIGVIDEGMEINHPDLIDNVWVNPFEIAGNGIDDDGNGFADDIHGWDFVNNDNGVYDGTSDDHGTHCAGTIGATGGNGIGVAGVAWDVSMVSIKFLGAGGGTLANAIKAVDYATGLKNLHGINLVATSNSWGGGGFSQFLLDAITRGANANILFVAAAGNGGSDSIGDDNDTLPFYPSGYDTTAGAGYDAVIAVASINSSGGLSSYSNFGDVTVDIGAPGEGIWSTVPTSTYGNYSGTSMATPHVAGAIALYASTKPVGTPAATVRQAILQSATPTASLVGKTVTGGRLNVYEAVRAQHGIQVSAPSPSAVTTEAGGAITFTVVLSSAPTADVAVPLTSSDTTEGSLSTNSLVFTPATWNIAQTVTVTGVDDFFVDGNIAYAITIGAATSSDSNYNGLNPDDINLTNNDNDAAGITVSTPSSNFTTEAGGTVTFTVQLTSMPTADVSIAVSSSDTTEGTVSPASLVFTAANWNSPQTVTVTGVNDAIDDGNINYTIILGLAVSNDPSYNGRNPSDVNLTNQDDDTAGIIVSPPSGTTTTEGGGSIFFSVRLNSEPLASVNIPLSSSDTTEGTVSVSSLVFSAANWNTPQTVTVRGVDDLLVDGNILYNALVWAASSTDALYNGINPTDISLTNIDNEPVPTKFFVVNDAAADLTYEYNSGGGAIENYALTVANTAPRGVAANAAGDKVWVVDSNRTVYLYNNSGVLLGSWMAGGMPSNAIVEGVATNGTHIWIVESGGDRVYYYPNAAMRTSGTQNATSNFLLNSANRNPKDLVTDGSSIWVVNDSTNDRVFKYSTLGTLQNSWAINSANSLPTGITLDPSNGSQDIWIVDSGTDRVYRYANARSLSAPTLTSFFPLAAGNTDPTGIADPPAGEPDSQFEVFVDGSIDMTPNRTPWVDGAFSSLLPFQTNPSTPRERDALQSSNSIDEVDFARFAASVKDKSSDWSTALAKHHLSAFNSSKSKTVKSATSKRTHEEIRDQVFAEVGSNQG